MFKKVLPVVQLFIKNPVEIHVLGFSLGLQPLLALLDSEYAIIQQLALESLIQITLDGN